MEGHWHTSLKKKTRDLPVMLWSMARCTDSNILRWALNLHSKGWYFFCQRKWNVWPPLLFLSLLVIVLWECLHNNHFRELKLKYIFSSLWKDICAKPESDTQTWCTEAFISTYEVQFQGRQIFFVVVASWSAVSIYLPLDLGSNQTKKLLFSSRRCCLKKAWKLP